MQVYFLGWEDPLEKENSNPLPYSCLENSMDREACSHGLPAHKESDTTEVTQHTYNTKQVMPF